MAGLAATGLRPREPSGAGGKWAGSIRGLPGVVRWRRATSTGAVGTDVADHHLGAVVAGPHRLARQLLGGRVLAPVQDHRGLGGAHDPGLAEGGGEVWLSRRCRRWRSSASISAVTRWGGC